MLSKEEIEKAKQDIKKSYVMSTKHCLDNDNKKLKQAIETLLQYIQDLEQENNKQNKMIDEMIRYIAKVDTDIFCDEDKYERDIEDNVIGCDEDCEECVKQYFEKKVEED